MSYASVDNLKAVIPPHDLALLTDFDGAANEADDARLAQALEDATAEMNGYLAKVVTLPLASTPDYLRVVCRDLAVYRLYANLSRVSEDQQNLRDAAVSYLKMVQNGKTSIGDATDTVQTSEGVVTAEGPDRVMTRDSLRRF